MFIFSRAGSLKLLIVYIYISTYIALAAPIPVTSVTPINQSISGRHLSTPQLDLPALRKRESPSTLHRARSDDGIQTLVRRESVGRKIKTAFQKVGKAIGTAAKVAFKAVATGASVVSKALSVIPGVGKAFGSIAKGVTKVSNAVSDAIKAPISAKVGKALNGMNTVQDPFAKIAGAGGRKAAKGLRVVFSR